MINQTFQPTTAHDGELQNLGAKIHNNKKSKKVSVLQQNFVRNKTHALRSF
jgi:hypothetical protein